MVVVEPGLIRTNFAEVTGQSFLKYSGDSAYGHMYDPMLKMMDDPKTAERGTEVSVLGETIAMAATVE